MPADSVGMYGSLLHYMLTIAFMGSAFFLFFFFWKKGRLDFDEEPKTQMLKESDEGRKDG